MLQESINGTIIMQITCDHLSETKFGQFNGLQNLYFGIDFRFAEITEWSSSYHPWEYDTFPNRFYKPLIEV